MIATVIKGLGPRSEIVLTIALFAGWFIVQSTAAVLADFPTPVFSDAGLLNITIFEIISLALAGAVLYVRGWRLRDFNLRPSWTGILVGLLLFGATLIFHVGIWDLFKVDAPEKTFLAEMAVAVSVGLPIALLSSVVNGFYEELFLTGYLLKALQGAGAGVALGVSALVRLSYHLYQGPLGSVSVLVFGLVLTLYYWRYRQLWPVVFAHIFADFAALA